MRGLWRPVGWTWCLLVAACGAVVLAQAPKPTSKILYILPYFPEFNSRTDAQFAADVTDLRARLGEGPFVRVGFNLYIFVTMDRWDVDPADRATLRANLSSALAQIDNAVSRARTHGIPLSLSMLTAIRERQDPVQVGAEREDRRNVQWYANGDIAPGWITHSRYARKLRGVFEGYLREVGAAFAAQMAANPSTLMAVSGDGEVELTFDRSPPFSSTHTAATMELADYSPFAIAEFRDWLRNAGLYATGQPFAGQGYAQAARYAGDASPSVDTNGDGRTLNSDFGTTFTSWSLRHFDWSLTDGVAVDSNAIPAVVYDRPGFNALPGSDPSRFDAPRVRQPGQPWWEVWDRFRQEMIWHYNLDVARWMTSSPDPVSGATIPADRWYSHQVPADYLFGFSPANPDLRYITSASPHWTADISPYGSLGITAFGVNLGNDQFARTLATVVPHVAQRKVRWGILEWNPALPVSSSTAIYDAEMALIEQYRPSLLVPWAWRDSFYQVDASPFETALRGLVSRLKDGPVRDPAAAFQPRFFGPVDRQHLLKTLRTLPAPDTLRAQQRRTLDDARRPR